MRSIIRRRLTAHGIALCSCGVDMVDHDSVNHPFTAAGTRHRCDKFVPGLGAFCPRPAYHEDEGVECGPLTGERLWT